MKIMLDKGAQMPTRAHRWDAGLDLYATENADLPPYNQVTVGTGVHIRLEPYTVGLLTSKSGLMANHGITSRGTIDCGYTGEIKVTLFNHSDKWYYINKGDKVSQLVVMPIHVPELELVDKLDDTERGGNGFGSTGR